ncbi:cysteine hydrolase family protein [Kribbella sp. NPDC050124]|uniref:cysteine hydrolase family protein n=1 Tax=Kribbella sp. NPDC050124 TaxID=3364114 RepID=UPI0037912528
MRTIHGKAVCETIEEVLQPDGCAVLAIDLQNDFISTDGAMAKRGADVSAMAGLAPVCADFMDAARELGVRIVHVRLVNLPNGESDSAPWMRFRGLTVDSTDWAVEGTWGAEFVEGCEPYEGELVVTKHRSSAFTGTNLDVLLRACGVKTVVVIGEQTPGCVEATYRDASYHDYYNVLVEDCVMGRDRELHEASILIQKARHDVVTAAQALSIWRRYYDEGRGRASRSGAAEFD